MGELCRPRPINRHAAPKAAGCEGPRRFALALSLLGMAKSMHALGPGATVGVLGTGVPRLACLRPAGWLKGGPARPIFINTRPNTLARGQSSQGGRHGASSGAASSGWLTDR